MPLVELSAIPQVPLAFMNEDHREEARLLNELAEALEAHRGGEVPRRVVLERWDPLYRHTAEHFGREEAAMQRVGFPPYPVHKAEHERVLEEMREQARQFTESGDAERLWRYVSEAVPAWFVQHIQSMDHVTGGFIAMRGG